VEDHPLEYRKFEGVIPQEQYGGGEVIVWDQGTYEVEGHLDADAQLARGELKFILHGEKVRGSFVLIKLKNSKVKNEWLLIKHRDEFADPLWDAEKHVQSIVSGRTLEDVKLGRPARAPLEANKISSLPGARKVPIAALHFADAGIVKRETVLKSGLALRSEVGRGARPRVSRKRHSCGTLTCR